MGSTRDDVITLRKRGLGTVAIARELGIAKSTVCHHLRRLGHAPDERYNRRYDWDAVQRFHDEGHSARECLEHYGFSSETWHSAKRRGAIVTRPSGQPVVDLLATATRNRVSLRRRLVREGLLDERCGECGITEWRGAKLALELHHRNGVGEDNQLENLQLLCPNCHSQTESWGGRNRGSRRAVVEVDVDAAPGSRRRPTTYRGA